MGSKIYPKWKIFLISFLASLGLEILISPIRGFVGLGASSVAGLFFFFGLVVFLKSRFPYAKSILPVFLGVLTGLAAIHLPIRISDFNGTLGSLPDFLCHLLGAVSGYLFLIMRYSVRWMPFIAGLIFSLFMMVKGYDSWLFRLNFGSYTGSVNYKSPISITGHDQFANSISDAQLKNKVLVLDFWHTRCGVCFQKFPLFQKLYDKMRNDTSIQFFAVNKHLGQDTLNQAINMIKKYKYNFPVLLPDNDMLPEAFGVVSYPTTIIINQLENVVYRGDIEHAEKSIMKLLTKK